MIKILAKLLSVVFIFNNKNVQVVLHCWIIAIALNSIDYISSVDTGLEINPEQLMEIKIHVLRLHRVSLMSSCFVIVSRRGISSI